jgi:alanine racemase
VRPIQATISAAALAHNYAVARRAASGAKVLAVVKANAYGHGVERVARALPGADGFGTVELDSALAIRERGFAGPVLLLEGFFEPRSWTRSPALRSPPSVTTRSSCACSRGGAARAPSTCSSRSTPG